MEKKLSKQILESITGIVNESDGYKVEYRVYSEPVKSFTGKVLLEKTVVEIVLLKAV